ncbi:hypothetical protein DH2020_020298 [Rehmannia glutinosa]|uniref:MHD domain-containing protein n=1 Tax=Rehmannia glutinosa TaxID=99300 RepID=A0ABR0WJ95_REHGL
MPVAASAIYFLNLRGDVLINRLYRDDVGLVEDSFIYNKLSSSNSIDQQYGVHYVYLRDKLPTVVCVWVIRPTFTKASACEYVLFLHAPIFLDANESEPDLRPQEEMICIIAYNFILCNMVDAFRVHIMQTKELGTCPVRQIGGCSFFYMRISNVYIVIVVSSNANVACAFKFVVEAVTLFKSYFGGAFDEDAIRNNFVLIYELLDEIMDFGYPQNLSPEILKLYITQEGVRSPFSSKAADKPVPNATLQVTGAVGWRREGLVYKKNEVFLDIVESVNLLMSSKGSVLRCDVTGKILMKCFLSGMPDLKLGLNDKIGLEKESQLKSRPAKSGKTIELDDVTFHQCVNLTRFNSEKTVSFVPPDGEFELMKYRITEGVNLPFRVLPTIKELGRTRMEVNVKVKSVFGAKMFALGVVIKIPVPKQTAKTSFQVTSGRAKYSPSIDCLVWKIRKFPGQTEPTLSAEVELISTMTEKKSWTRPPIQMEFQVPMFTASGLRVRFLKVWEKSGYNTVEWVRYITKAGSYEISWNLIPILQMQKYYSIVDVMLELKKDAEKTEKSVVDAKEIKELGDGGCALALEEKYREM